VSHELRNPLNSIQTMNLKMWDLVISFLGKIEAGEILADAYTLNFANALKESL
jgi:signal transduction histidine kinase